jgi:hypothetical protein
MTDPKPGEPEVLVAITRYTVSVIPADDINRRYFTLFVELMRDGWVVSDGHAFYAGEDTWQPAQWLAYRFADVDDALALARRLAPGLTVNGHTAVEAYQRTHPGPPPTV